MWSCNMMRFCIFYNAKLSKPFGQLSAIYLEFVLNFFANSLGDINFLIAI